MNENAKNWVKALRSGEYQQGTGYLKRGDQFCCLGVACEVYQKSEAGKSEPLDIKTAGDMNPPYTKYNEEACFLPSVVMRWLGLANTRAEFKNSDEIKGHLTLVSLNDSTYSFEQIAQIIEDKEATLFV